MKATQDLSLVLEYTCVLYSLVFNTLTLAIKELLVGWLVESDVLQQKKKNTEMCRTKLGNQLMYTATVYDKKINK